MKKNYALLTGLIFVTSLGFSQSLNKFQNEEAKLKLTEQVDPMNANGNSSKVRSNQAKVPGTVLYSETFANQVPAGWTITNNAGNSNNWIWSNTAPGGQYSTNTAAINSTTAANGFMSLPADLYNTPFPTGGPLAMDVWFTSPAITIPATASVELRFEQSQRYCCAGADELVAEVSPDNITWTTFDANFGRGANTAVPSTTSDPAELATFNVSGVLANQTTAYLRFRQTGATHYYWMIDDVQLVEGAANAMTITDYQIVFADTSNPLISISPILSFIPNLALSPLTFSVTTINDGSNTQTGVDFVVDVLHDSTWVNAPGTGLGVLTTVNTLYGIPVPSAQVDVVTAGTYVNTVDGYMRAIFSIETDSVSQDPSKATASQSFVVTDSVLAVAYAPYVGDAGPGNYVGGGNDGDRWASLMSVGTHPNAPAIVCNSISLLVANVTSNDGSSIGPRIWEWNDTASTIAGALGTAPIGSSPFSTTIDTTMLGNWITLPIFPSAIITAGKQYAVGWEQTGGASTGAEFTVARSRDAETRAPNVSNFVYVNDAAPSWGWVTQIGAIRLNLALPVGIDEASENSVSSFTVSPNPSNGIFKVNVSSNNSVSYELDVRNMLGQVVYSDNLNVKGEVSKSLDLTNLEKGVYFVSITNGSDRKVQKVVLN